MNQKIIANQSLNQQEREILAKFLDVMIPADEQLQTPSAGSDSIVDDIIQSLRGSGYETVKEAISKFEELSNTLFDEPFVKLSFDQRASILKQIQHDTRYLGPLGSVLLQCYYRDDDVMRSLGMEPRAPFPKGFELEQGDFNLLEPVRAREKIWRDA